MRFRTGLMVGFGVGYVMGSKAGRSRYEQIRRASTTAWDSEAGRRVREGTHRAIDEVGGKALGALRSLSGHPETIDLTVAQTDHAGHDALYRESH